MNNRWWKCPAAALWPGVFASAFALAFASVALAQQGGAPGAPAPVVYVSDFELDAADITPDQSRLSRARRLAGSLSPLHLSEQDPQKKAQELVAKMSESLVADLQRDGIDARRLPGDAPLPPQGWLVRGVFVSVDEAIACGAPSWASARDRARSNWRSPSIPCPMNRPRRSIKQLKGRRTGTFPARSSSSIRMQRPHAT